MSAAKYGAISRVRLPWAPTKKHEVDLRGADRILASTIVPEILEDLAAFKVAVLVTPVRSLGMVWRHCSGLGRKESELAFLRLLFRSQTLPGKDRPRTCLKGRHLGRVGDRFVAPGSRAHVVHGIAPAPRAGQIGIALVQR